MVIRGCETHQIDFQTRKDENCATFGTLKTQVFFNQNFHNFHDFLSRKWLERATHLKAIYMGSTAPD